MRLYTRSATNTYLCNYVKTNKEKHFFEIECNRFKQTIKKSM